jgi:hypothetical protein
VGRLALQVGMERLACMIGQLVFHSTHGNDVTFLVARSSPSGETLGATPRNLNPPISPEPSEGRVWSRR